MEEGGDSDSDKTVRLEDYHKISWRKKSKSHGGRVRNAATGMEGGDSDSDKTVRLEDYHCQPETMPPRTLTEEHGGLIQAPNEYETTPNAYVPSYELARDVRIGKQLVLSRFLGSNFEKLVIDSSSNDNQENQHSNSTLRDYEIKRELLNHVSEDVKDNTTHTDKNIIVIDSSDEEHSVEFDYKSDEKVDENKYPSPLNTPVTIKNGFEMGDLELTANDVPPPITNVNKPTIRIKVLHPKAINEQAAARICSESCDDDKTKLNKNIASSTRRSDRENMDNLKDLTTLCKSNNSTVCAPTSNENVSSNSVIQTVAKNTGAKISESTNKNWNETANRSEDNARNTKVNTTEIVAKSSTAERVKLLSPENSMSEKGHVENNNLLNINAEETRRQVNRLSDKDTLSTSCKRMRTDDEESSKNTLHSVCNNDVKVDTNNHINTNILDLCTNTHQKKSQNAGIVINEQHEKETSKIHTLKEFVNDNISCGENLKNLNKKKSISKFLSRFCSFMMEHLLEKWKSLSEDAENKNAFSKSARLLADEIRKLDALRKTDLQLNCPVCSRISTFTGIRLYDYYNHDTEGKQQNRFKKCYLCYGFQKKYNSMIKPLLPMQSNKSDGAKSFESNQNIQSQRRPQIMHKIGTPLKYNKDADNEPTVNSLSKTEISVLDISSKRDNDNNQNECSVKSINNKNKLENIKHSSSLPESINKETDAPNSFATLENENIISHRTDSLTLEGNISTTAKKDSVGREATSIETVHRHPVDVVIRTSSTSNNKYDPEHIVDNLKSKASIIPAIDTNLIKTKMSEKLDNVDKYHKVENNIGKTNIPNIEQESKLISTTTSVDCPIVKTPVTDPKRIFVEIKGNAKYMPVDRDSRSATPLPIVMEKVKKDHANVLRPEKNAVSEGTNKPVIEKCTKKAYDVNKTIPNNNDTDNNNLTANKRKNKEMHIKPVGRSLITRTSDIDLPLTPSNIKTNTSKDVTEVKNLSDTVKARRKSKETSSSSVSENPIGKTPDENLPSLSKDKDHSIYKLGIITTETPKVMPGNRSLSEESPEPNSAEKSKNDGTNRLKTADRVGGKSTLVTTAIKPSSGSENDTTLFQTSNDKDISDHRVDSITTEVKSFSDTAKARRNSKEMSGRSASENPIGRTTVENLSSLSKDKDHSIYKLGNITTETPKVMPENRSLSEESPEPNIAEKSKNNGTNRLKTADRVGGKSTLVTTAIKPSSGSENDTTLFQTSNDKDISDHRVDRITTEVKSFSDTAKARRNSKEMSGRSAGENPIGRTMVENLSSLSKDKDHSIYKLGNITTETPKVMPENRSLSEESPEPNIAEKSKNDGTNRLKTADRVGGKSTLVTTAIKPSSGSENDTTLFKTSNDKDISDHRVDRITTEVKSFSDTAKARRNSKEMSGRCAGENPIGRTPDEKLPSLSKDKDHSTYKLGNIMTETPKDMPGDRCLSEKSSVLNIAAKSKNDGTNQLKTADRLGGKGTLVTSAIKSSSGTGDDTTLFKTSNDKYISDHIVDSITTEVNSLSDTAKARRNSKEMSGRSVGENPLGRTQGVDWPSKSKNKGHSNDKLGNIKANTSTAISVDRCQNISKDDSSDHLKRTGDELVSKATLIKLAVQHPDQRAYDIKISKISSNVGVSDHSIDNAHVPERQTRDSKVQDKQLSEGVHKRRLSSELNNENFIEERHLTKEKSLFNIHQKTNNDVSNYNNSIPKEAYILMMTAGDKKVSGGISIGTQDSISSKRPNSTPSNNDEVLNRAIDNVSIENKDENIDVFIASAHSNDKNFKIHELDRVSKKTTFTSESVQSSVLQSNNNDTNLNISGVNAKTNILPVKAPKRSISIDTSVFNTPPKIYKDQIGNTSVRSIPSKPEASKDLIITSIPAELISKKSNHPVIIDPKAADIVSTNNPNKNPRAGIFIDDEASTKIYYDNTHQRVNRVVTEANHFALEAENSNPASSSSASAPTEAAKRRNNNPTAMSSREILAQLLPPDEDDCYKNTCEISKTNKRNIANDEAQTSPKRMKKNNVKIGTNDDVRNALSNKSPKNDIEDAMNHALTDSEPFASVHLSCKNSPIESHVEKTTKNNFDDSNKIDSFREMLLCEDDEVIEYPFLHSTDISVSKDNQTKHITSVKGQNNKLTENHTDEESNNTNTNKAKDGHKPHEANIIKKTSERQKQENKTTYETSKNIKTLENDKKNDRFHKKVVEKDSAKGVAETSDGDSANGSVNVKENKANGLVLNSLENCQEKSTTIVEAEAETLFLETSKKIINCKILYECPICSCIFQDSNIYLSHLKSDHNLSTPVLPETVELNNDSNQNDEAESGNKLKNSVINTEVKLQHVERVPHGRGKYIYKCSICKDNLHTYYSARTHKREYHPKKKYIQIFKRILVDCETGKQIMDTNHTSDYDDDNNENKEATENEVYDEDINIEGNNSSDNDGNNEIRSNMSNNNVVIISDEEDVDEQSNDVGQPKISDVSSSSPDENNHEKNSQSNGNDSSTSDSNSKGPNGVVCQAGVSDENKQSSSDKVYHGHDISFSNQDNIHKSIDESDANSVNKDSKNGNDMEVEEETREGRSENNDEQLHYRRNIKPNDENVIKYGYKCKICNVVCRSKYASFRHREIKHFQMRNRQLFDRVILCHRLYNQEKEKNINSVGKSIPIGESSLQSVSIDNHENKTKEKAQTEAEDNQQKSKQINSDQEHQGKERDYESNKTNGDKLHTNNHNSTEKLNNAPESSSTHNSHNLVKFLSAGIRHINQKENKESSNNQDQLNNKIIHNSNDIDDRQSLNSTVSSNFPNELSSHHPMDDNVDDNVQSGSKQKEDKTNYKRTVHDSETNNRETGDEITLNQSDHKIIQTKKLPVSPDAYVLSCLDCGYTTEICDSLIRHCQNHYNDVRDLTTHCTICQLNFDTDNFESHQNLHGKHVGIEVVKYSYKSLFSDWDKIFDDIPADTVKDFRKKSIYKTNCIKMVLTESGPWEDSLYQCGECSTCVPSQEIEQHFQENCYFVSYPCSICKRYFTSLEMLVEHERNHAKSYRVVAFNNIKDKNFNCKLLEARKHQQDLMNEKVRATIYKCACELCFATSNSFKIHFIECDFRTKNGVLCSKCTVPLHFESTELENHEELHHSATKCKLLVYRVTVNEEKVPDEDDGNDNDNTKDTTVSHPKRFLNNAAEMDIKKDLLKHDTTDSQED